MQAIARAELGNSIEKASTGGARTPDKVKEFVSAVVGTRVSVLCCGSELLLCAMCCAV